MNAGIPTRLMRHAAGLMPMTLACWLPALACADIFVSEAVITDPRPAGFSVCYGHSCAQVQQVALSAEQWREVAALFQPPSPEAADERRRIARAIARLETLVGALTGTDKDRGGNWDGWLSGDAQMDCIDESTNTTSYLRMLARDGLLRWHTVEDRATRGWFLFGWPHTTAVIRDNRSDRQYAVDSWFRDNGRPPVIQPLDDWRDKHPPPTGDGR